MSVKFNHGLDENIGHVSSTILYMMLGKIWIQNDCLDVLACDASIEMDIGI
jgi:hypothetical protein